MRMPLLTLALAAGGLAAAAQAQTNAPPPMPRAPGGAMMRADLNHDGVITREEASAEAASRFDAMDANHDGMLTGDERKAYRDAMRAARHGGAAQGDGKAPPPPAAAMPAGGHGPRGGNDRTISRTDYIARATARFDRMDANHDGKLDQGEMAQMRPFGGRRGGAMGGDMPPPPPPSDQ